MEWSGCVKALGVKDYITKVKHTLLSAGWVTVQLIGVNNFYSYGFATKTLDAGFSIALDYFQVIVIKLLWLQVRSYSLFHIKGIFGVIIVFYF